MKRITKLEEIGIEYKTQMQEYAEFYAGKGWHIIPLHNPVFDTPDSEARCSCGIPACDKIGKHPRVKDWGSKATIDLTQISEWFNSWPDMNIGIVTGAISGLAVLDADGLKGKRSLMSVESVPYTATVKSGVGLHYYLRYPDKLVKTVANVMPGLDSRGDGGYVCAPPSLHRRGYRYEWLLATDLAKVPKWWLDLVEKPVLEAIQEIKFDVTINSAQMHAYGRTAMANELAKLYSTPVGQGLRNKNLNRASFSLGQLIPEGYLPEDLVRSCLWDAAINGMKMEEEEARKTMESGLAGGKMKPRKLVSR